ncbi:Ger(x)C family germination protein [Cytobacillus firmus]|uniref:Ger(X)C family germination protein n=2 Tax=Cytobacillus TaxID=2675230 RepID=A0A366JH14_CYTFI|nr:MULTISPECIES: Ger(x)C family spore germination protein [Cytobacillus]RBP86295.1 Ger(x)C family germination protein [Cytobacillus firmus]TDX35917.1 Ger(x)C family germination protein [Cytobacillus oceanisediminis]
MKSLGVIAIILVLLLSSCTNSEEVDKLSLISAVGLEKMPDNEYKIIIQYLMPKKDQEPLPITKEVDGLSIYEANNNLNEFLPRKPYWSHNFVILLSEELAKEGIRSQLDFFRRNPEMRQDTLVAITESPRKILYNLQKQQLSGQTLKLIARQASARKGLGEVSTLHKVYQNLFFKKPFLTITHIFLDGENPRIDGFSIFDKDKYITTIKGDEARGLGFLKLKNKYSSVTMNCLDKENRQITFNLTNIHKKTNAYVNDLGIFEIRLSLEFEAFLAESHCMRNISDTDTIKKLEKALNKKIKELAKKTIEHSQQNVEIDYFGFGNLLYLNHPKKWKEIEGEYETVYKNADIKLKINTKIVQTGAVN